MQAISRKTLPSPYDLLAMAWSEVVACASEVGIDAQALRHTLPTSGQRLSGRNVPVLEPRYRNACSVTLYINPLPGGGAWPFLRFFTFKDGGRYRDFNGLRWWQTCGQRRAEQPPLDPPVVAKAPVHARERLDTACERRERFQRWAKRWQVAECLTCQHRWLKQRLIGMAGPDLLKRVTLREQAGFSGNIVMAPLEREGVEEAVGYQLILCAGNERPQEQKRMVIHEEGASRGAFIRVREKTEGCTLPVALCEGLATGLSLALVWPGEIRVALNAHNLAAVRKGVQGAAIFFHDDDQWKPQVGNVGYRAANDAMQPGDTLYGPIFSSDALGANPTDFNDLLYLDGIQALSEQLGHIYAEHSLY